MPAGALKGRGLMRYVALVIAATVGILFLIETVAWLLSPGRFNDPPPVTADAWIHSDALPTAGTSWMREYVDEFCRSYDAHWSSYVYFQRKPFAGKFINIDTLGIRYTPQAAEAGTGPVRRVFLLGGSTMWGTGARDSFTIPSQLARRIARDPLAAQVRVINLGESGYVSTQSVLRLELELRKGNIPDIAILYDGVNDVFSTLQNDAAGLPQNESHRALEFNLLKEAGRMRKLGLEDFLGRTFLASIVRDIQSAFKKPQEPSPPRMELAAPVVRLYRGNLEIMDALSKQFGFHYAAYWQPVVFSRKNPSPYERQQSQLQAVARPLFEETYRRVKQDPALGKNPLFHNLSEIFDGLDRPVYLDFCHLSEAGDSIIAERMYSDISPLLQGKATARSTIAQ